MYRVITVNVIQRVLTYNHIMYLCINVISANYYSALYIIQTALKVPLSLKWSKRAQMPFRVGDYPQAILVKGKVHIGGGWSLSGNERRTVLVYDVQHDAWTTLEPYKYERFALAAINDRLVVIGGFNTKKNESIAKLGAWNEKWEKPAPFPPMPTARKSPLAVTHNRWLVVVGGENELDVLPTVEILDTSLNQWYLGVPIPNPCYCASAVMVGNTLYALGGYTTDGTESRGMISVSLDELISIARQQPPIETNDQLEESLNPTKSLRGFSIPMLPRAIQPISAAFRPSKSPWKTLANTPLTHSTALLLKGAVLTVGGLERNCFRKDIYVYRPDSEKWVKAGELQTERAMCACTILPAGRDILVAGGVTGKGKYGSMVGSITENASKIVELAIVN